MELTDIAPDILRLVRMHAVGNPDTVTSFFKLSGQGFAHRPLAAGYQYFHFSPSSMAIILAPALPSPKGFSQSVFFLSMALAYSMIFSGDAPARRLAPTSTVCGLSVLSRRVTLGARRIQASSCTPPESVSISRALLSNWRKSRKSTGSTIVRRRGLRPNVSIIFRDRG